MKYLFFSFFLFNFLFSNPFNRKIEDIVEISKNSYEKNIFDKSRIYSDIKLKSNISDVNFLISYPKNITKNTKVLILTDGLETSKNAIDYFKPLDDYIIIGLEFDKTLYYLKSKEAIFHIFPLREALINTPFQIITIVKWLEKQNFYNKAPIIMGISFGGIFVPAAYQVANYNNIKLGPCILAYVGADLYQIFYQSLKNYFLFRKTIARAAAFMFNPIDPKYHMQYIKSDLLIINGEDDTFIPKKSYDLLQKLANKKATIINLKSKHIMPDNKTLIEEIYKISLNWLENR